MQFYLRFAVNRLTVPMAHHYQVMSMLYNTMRYDEEYSTMLHDFGFQYGKRVYRMFCFGKLSGVHTINRERKEITFPKEVFLEVRTADEQLAGLWIEALRPGLQLRLCGHPMLLTDVIEKEDTITEKSCRIEMLSPILAYKTIEKHTWYYNPLEPEFAQLVSGNFVRKYTAFTGKEPQGIQLISEAIGIRDKVVAQFKGIYLTAWGGQYLLKGKPEYLNFLYNTGLGAKNAGGFGMFHVLE